MAPEASCSVLGSQRQNARLSMDWVITFQAFLITTSHPHEGLCVTLGCFEEAFSVRILAQTFEDGADCAGEPLFPLKLFGRGGIQSKEGGLCWKTINKKRFIRYPHTGVPGHPRPFGSGIGLSAPVGGEGDEPPELGRKGALLESAAGLWESIISFVRFGRKSFMTCSVSLAPSAWLRSRESWRFWRLAARRVEWDLGSKWLRAMLGDATGGRAEVYKRKTRVREM